MDLDAPIDITIGPYESYTDELFGDKAAFEAYVNIRDDAETNKVKFFTGHLQEIENNLPNDERVVQQKGSKRVMLKNVQEAKFNQILIPIAARVLARNAQADLSFDDATGLLQ